MNNQRLRELDKQIAEDQRKIQDKLRKSNFWLQIAMGLNILAMTLVIIAMLMGD